MAVRAEEGGESESQLVMSWIGVQNLPHVERRQTSAWSLVTR